MLATPKYIPYFLLRPVRLFRDYDRSDLRPDLIAAVTVTVILLPQDRNGSQDLSLIETTWRDWKEQYPETLVLSLKTGYLRPYHEDPYDIRAVRALGVIFGGSTQAYSFEQLKKVKTFPVRDRVGEQRVLVHFRKGTEKAWATDVEGRPVEFFLT